MYHMWCQCSWVHSLHYCVLSWVPVDGMILVNLFIVVHLLDDNGPIVVYVPDPKLYTTISVCLAHFVYIILIFILFFKKKKILYSFSTFIHNKHLCQVYTLIYGFETLETIMGICFISSIVRIDRLYSKSR